MRLALTLIAALAVVLLVTGHPLTALTAYLGAGGLWTLYDLRRPLHSRPIGHSTLIGSAILFLLWPFRMAYDIVWYLQTIKRGERFVVHGQGESLKFAIGANASALSLLAPTVLDRPGQRRAYSNLPALASGPPGPRASGRTRESRFKSRRAGGDRRTLRLTRSRVLVLALPG